MVCLHGKRLSSMALLLAAGALMLASAESSIEIPRISLPFSSRGIIVPKRPAIIAGLEHSFRGYKKANSASNSSQPSTLASSPSSNSAKGLLESLSASLGGQQVAPNKAQGPEQQVLYLDKRQQEQLAADPNYAITGAGSLLRRSDVSATASSGPNSLVQRLLAQSPPQSSANSNSSAPMIDSGLAQQQQQQQQFRGYSLVELEVRCEQDRRYVQDLYSNLSAALNEQAQRPQTLTVSPYADIDFWSFKNGVNDHIDIMVSPKSRQFMLNQLARAKIKHRVKIDDIQARLEQQQQQQQLSGVSGGGGAASTSSDQLQLSGRQSADEQVQRAKLSSRQDAPQGQLGGATPAPSSSSSNSGQSLFLNDSLFFENYQRLGDINQYLESLVGRARDVARVQVIGRSSQGRYLRVLRLGHEQRDADGSTLETDHLAAVASGSQLQQGVQLNASKIVEQFLRREQSIRKLGSIWLDGGTHAREWISPATVLYIAFRLTDNHARCLRFFDHLQQLVTQQQQQQQQQVFEAAASRQARRLGGEPSELLEFNLITELKQENNNNNAGARLSQRSEVEQKLELLAKRPQEVASEHGCDLELEQLLRRYTFYMEPVLNPDGYEYSHTHNRLWRKTRSTSQHPIYRHFCLGADPNRNYDARHGSTGSSSHPCSQTYGGTTPFTEPETKHQSNFVYAHRSNMKMYISFHSYSQMILLPFSHSKQLAPDHKDLESVGQAAVKAIERTHGTQYRVGASASILYTASGTASDWAYEKAGVKYSYTIELRDTGAYGFLLPKQQIIPTGEETFNGLLAMIGQMEKNDNLLMSKSSPVIGAAGRTSNSSELDERLNEVAPLDFVHAPDLDQLRPFGRFRPKPAQLENVLDGTDTWATPGPRSPGVRDRKPAQVVADDAESVSSRVELLGKETISTDDDEPDAGLAFEGEGELMEPTDHELAARAEAAAAAATSLNSSQQISGRVGEIARQRHRSILESPSLLAAAREAQKQAAMSTRSQTLVAEKLRKRSEGNSQTLASLSNGRNLINHPSQVVRTSAAPNRRESSELLRSSAPA